MIRCPGLSLIGSVLDDGLCSTDLPGKPARHRSMPAFSDRQLYHLGIRSKVARTTLADANESRDWRIFADFAQVLIRIARPLYAADPSAWTSTTAYTHWIPPPSISACRSFLGRSSPTQRRCEDAHAAGLAWQYPHVISITNGKVHDVNILDEMCRRPERSTSWIAATWISSVFTSSRLARPSSLCAPSPMS